MDTDRESGSRRLADNLAVVSFYIAATPLNRFLEIPSASGASVWTPMDVALAGVVLGAVLIRGLHVWPGVFAGALIESVWSCFNAAFPGGLAACVTYGFACGAGDAASAVASGYLILRGGSRRGVFHGVANVCRFVACGAILGPWIAALIGETAGCLLRAAPWSGYTASLLASWLASAVGVLILTPVIMDWCVGPRKIERPREFLALAAALAAAATVGFSLLPLEDPALPITFAVVPILIWSVLRFETRVSSSAILFVSIAAILATVGRHGPFTSKDLYRSLLELELFLAITAVTLLLLRGVLSEERQTVSVFRRSEERFRRLLDSAPDAMVLVDRDGMIRFVNEEAGRCFGYASQELLGGSVDILIPERLRNTHVERRRAFTATPKIRLMNHGSATRGRRKDGREFPAEVRLSPIELGRDMLIAAAIRDITERKQAEDVLRSRDAQLIAAQRIQRHLLPQSSPVVPGLDIHGASYPAEFTAGDHFDYLQMPDGSVGIVIGDVCGHGFSSALLMASTCAHLRSLAESPVEIHEILRRTNVVLSRETDEGRFVTLLFARYDPKSHSLVYCNAGHPPGWVITESGAVKAHLRSVNLPLAMVPDADFCLEGPLTVASGELLLLVTDGILEARSPGGEFFGADRVVSVVVEHRRRPSGQIVDRLHESVSRFTHRETPLDDVTVVVMKVENVAGPTP